MKRASSGSDGQSEGAVIVMEGVILRLLISSVGTPFVGSTISGMSAVPERKCSRGLEGWKSEDQAVVAQ